MRSPPSALGVSNGFDRYDAPLETRWQTARRVLLYVLAAWGTVDLMLRGLGLLTRWVIPG